LHRMGLIQDGIRLPLTWLSEKARGPLLQAMQQAKLV
ncbi:MAG: 4-hydroxy-tetrahydrodipicolinate synthase, partial [Gammaproteobacteria bacterium]